MLYLILFIVRLILLLEREYISIVEVDRIISNLKVYIK